MYVSALRLVAHFCSTMSFERPWLTFFVSGTTVMVASNVIYFVYRKLFAKKTTRNRWFFAQSNHTSNSTSKSGAEISESRKRGRAECRKRTEGDVAGEDEEAEAAERQLELRKPSDLWNTVIFFPDPSSKDGPRTSRDALLSYLRAAQTSIQICMYLTSSPQFVNIIREKYNQGLMVQVVTDYDTYTAHNNFGPKSWKRCGKQ